MSDRECFDFLKSINYNKQYFIDRGWTKKYWNNLQTYGGPLWWPLYFKDEPNEDSYNWFPPGFKLQEGYGKDNEDYPRECCANCKNSRSQHDYGCRLAEVRVATDSSVLYGNDYVSHGHSNPVFVWDVKFAPHAICNYFEQRELSYNI